MNKLYQIKYNKRKKGTKRPVIDGTVLVVVDEGENPVDIVLNLLEEQGFDVWWECDFELNGKKCQHDCCEEGENYEKEI